VPFPDQGLRCPDPTNPTLERPHQTTAFSTRGSQYTTAIMNGPQSLGPTFVAAPLMIGLSYSLDADGSPGYYNKVIAGLMEADYRALAEERPNSALWLGMQWEIWDALDGRDVQKVVPLTQVASPPRFSEADIRNTGAKDLNRLLTWLESPATVHADMVKVLNGVLDDGNFATHFQELQLPVLQRGGHRLIWVEERLVPRKFPLTRFQTWRVNRLIVERLSPNGINVGQYLGARAVFKMLFEQVATKGDVIQEVWLYAHPEHFPACRDDATFVANELSIRLGKIVDRTTDQWNGRLWDAQTAQSWCRSIELWRAYQTDMRLYYTGTEP
jgi:hypothetical protein